MGNKPKHDSIGDRMKRYEVRSCFYLPRRSYTVLRVDGKAFHTWTRGLDKPYDKQMMACMDAAAIELCKQIAGAKFAFVQSDEISILCTDFEDIASEAWFDGVVQKWASVSASIATMAFNMKVMEYGGTKTAYPAIGQKLPNATFDARVFCIPDYIEVENYFVWRQQDAARNSVTLLASAYASHKQLHGKSTEDRHEIIHQAGDNWAKHPVRFKHGGVIRKFCTLDIEANPLALTSKKNKKLNKLVDTVGGLGLAPELAKRGTWAVDEKTPVFTRKRAYLRNLIPRHWENDETTEKAAAHA